MKVVNKFISGYSAVCGKSMAFVTAHSNTLMLAGGVALLAGGMAELSLAQANPAAGNAAGAAGAGQNVFQETLIRNAVGNIFRLLEGAFGALVMVVAGLGAIVGAAMGAYRAAAGLMVVAIGAFVLRSLVSLFFGGGYVNGANGSNYGGATTAQ